MRKPRKYAKSGLYHIVIRGVNKQNIFYDDEDKKKFLSLLKKYSIKYNIKIHAYCLMENHVHLLLEDCQKNLSLFMQTLSSVYAKLFNKKYDRIGHLFQERFASEVIENTQYYKTVFRYIIQNPEKAGIANKKEFLWSSYNFYKKESIIICRERVIDFFGSIKEIYDFIDKRNNDFCLEIELRPSEKEADYLNKIKSLLNSQNPIISPDLSRKEIENQIKKLKKARIPTRIIARITELPTGIINRISSK